MIKHVVTLRSAPAVSVDVPLEAHGRPLQRLALGAVRLFPGIPKTVTEDELEWIQKLVPATGILVQPYVESRRVDKRGASEAEIERLAEKAGLGHLSHQVQVNKLRAQGLLKPQTVPAAPAPKLQLPKKEIKGASKDGKK